MEPLTPTPLPAKSTAVPGKFSRVATSACSRGVFGNFWHSRLETANLSHLNHLSPFPGQPCPSRERWSDGAGFGMTGGQAAAVRPALFRRLDRKSIERRGSARLGR